MPAPALRLQMSRVLSILKLLLTCKPSSGLALVMDYNGVATIYILSHIVFHVGSAGGSEHLFDGRRLPMEIQLFCRRQVYESFESALPYPGGTLAVSVLLELATVGRAWLLCPFFHIMRVG